MTWPTEDWHQLTADWHAVPPSDITAELLRRVHGWRRRMRWLVAAEILITLVIGGGAFAVLRQQPHATLWIAWVSVYIAVVCTFALWNRHGIARPAALTTRDCLDLLALRCRRRLRSARFTLLMVAIHAPVAAALLLSGGSFGPRRLAGAALIALMFAALTAGALIMRARARRELASLTTLSASLNS